MATSQEATAELGKREFVRALSFDEEDPEGDGTGAKVASVAVGAAKAAAPAGPTHDLRYPRFVPDERNDGWWEPDAQELSVRGKKYLQDKKKVKSGPSAFDCVCVEMFQVPKKIRKVEHICSRPFSQFRRHWKPAPKDTPYKGAPGSNFLFVVQFQAPGYSLVMYYQRKADETLGSEGAGPEFESALRAFMEGDLEYKTRHLKFFPVVVEGSWIVRKVVGGKPAIIAKKIDTTFHEGENYFEVDVDVSSSSVAKNILRVVKSYAVKMSFDLAWGFEGKTEEHLPERIMGISRFEHVNPDLLPFVPEAESEEGGAEAAQ